MPVESLTLAVMSNILDTSALLSSLPSLLNGSTKVLSSPQDGIAALVHTIMSAVAFRLVALDDSTQTHVFENNVLPEEWNKHGPGSYAFQYRHDQSSLRFLVKVSKLGSRTMINAIALESDKAATLDIATQDFTSPSFFPHAVTDADASTLVNGFITANRVEDFVVQYKLKILQNLIPGLNQKGYTEEPATTSSNRAERAELHSSMPRPRPITPPFDPSPLFTTQPFPRNPLEIGRSDRDPFAGSNPFAPPSLFPGSGGDGMLVGPNHPIFSRRDYDPLRSPNHGRGPWGGDGYLPPMGAPPGARFDPVGPIGMRGPQGMYPRPPGYLSGEPDNDEFMPPGASDMFS